MIRFHAGRTANELLHTEDCFVWLSPKQYRRVAKRVRKLGSSMNATSYTSFKVM